LFAIFGKEEVIPTEKTATEKTDTSVDATAAEDNV